MSCLSLKCVFGWDEVDRHARETLPTGEPVCTSETETELCAGRSRVEGALLCAVMRAFIYNTHTQTHTCLKIGYFLTCILLDA